MLTGKILASALAGLMNWAFLAGGGPCFAAAGGDMQQARSEKESSILEIQQFIQMNDLEGARAALSRAMKRYPGDGGLENLRGIIEAQTGDYRAAEAAFHAAIRKMPRFVNAYLNLGRLYQENALNDEGALANALRIYQQLLRYVPDNVEARYQTAILLQRTGNPGGSLAHLLKLPEQFQSRVDVLALYVTAYDASGDRARSGDAAARLLRLPEMTTEDVVFAVSFLGKKPDLAVSLFEELARRGLSTPQTMRQQALLYEGRGDLARARETLERAGAVSVEGLTDLARIAFQQKDFRGALGYLAHARDIEPGNARIHYLFGQTCVRLELIAEALQSFTRAVELEQSNPDYNYAAGAASAYLRDPVEAIPYFRKYLELRPRDVRGRMLLGAVYFKSGDYPAARKELTAASLRPDTAPNAHYYLGRIARQQGELETAVAELKRAAQLDPRHASALAELGQCYIQMRDYPAAERVLERSLRLDPDNYAANFNLLTLYSRTDDPRRAEQETRFEDVRRRRTEREQDFLRAIETRPR